MVIVRKAVPGLSEVTLARFVARALRALGLRQGASILLTTNREMKSLNLRFRGKAAPTDVLSFSAPAGLESHIAGDIAISTEMAAQNAKRLGHSAAEEVKVLALHGLLHLAGYDHERDNGLMEQEEHRLRVSLGLPDGLIERAKSGALARRSRRGGNNPQRLVAAKRKSAGRKP
jgi:probable rRNA maturation factor